MQRGLFGNCQGDFRFVVVLCHFGCGLSEQARNDQDAVPILQVLLAVIVVLAIVSLVLAFTGRRKPPTSPEPPEPSEL